jgi:2-polyprenyl-3-methyl-5-hydroxy-6-metoxy-1,4-benzoquinol methylase
MSAHYDSYDYPTYWEGRDYEHQSEVIAIKELLAKIPKIKNILEIGAGFGRLVPTYAYRGKKIILTDPSSKLLNVARNNPSLSKKRNIIYKQSTLQNITNKVAKKSIDLAIMVRVIHHLEDPIEAFKIVNSLLKPRGYFILEFANKSHAKAMLKEMAQGNLTFPLDIFPKDLSSKKSLKSHCLPFINYHPDKMEEMLRAEGFEIIERRSVSNIRSTWLKKLISLKASLAVEKILQKPFACINFGPSLFLLVRKKA